MLRIQEQHSNLGKERLLVLSYSKCFESFHHPCCKQAKKKSHTGFTGFAVHNLSHVSSTQNFLLHRRALNV